MFGEEVKGLLVQVISSWQVLVVTAVLVIYAFIVNYAARTHRRFYQPRRTNKVKAKEAVPDAPAPSDNDELGLDDGSSKK